MFFYLLLVSSVSSNPVWGDDKLTEIVVTAELLENNALNLPSSVSVIDAAQIEQHNAQHLADLLGLAPNVNFATGASRGRFVQIRGIGERSEFQEPIINSVGVLLDGIDMTGIATAATTLDIQQVEVLRGPQGTLFGANAMAGLINLVSNAPSKQSSASLGVAVEGYGGREFNGMLSGPLSASAGYRFAIKHYQSDGFTENIFLGRDDTNNIDETTARGRISLQPSDQLKLDFTLLLADIDNGYDAFSLDNTRQTYSDQPGTDTQQTQALAVNVEYSLDQQLSLIGLLSHAQSELEYSYDEDWSHPGICENNVCDSDLFGFDWFYESSDNYQRDNDNTSVDLRLVSTASDARQWVLGLYLRQQSIDLLRQYTFNEQNFFSALDTKNQAIYGQLDQALAGNWSLSTGLRYENRQVDYADNNRATTDTDENQWGGRIALQYLAESGAFYYGLISRGYKAGGFNLDEAISADQREFDSETLINYELGLKRQFLDNRLRLQASAFYQDRDKIQTKQSIVASIDSGEVGGNCPCSFTDFTANAASGNNYGLEVELQWQASERLAVFAALGLLETEFDTLLTFEHVNADREGGIPYDLADREQAHAPAYQWLLGGSYALSSNWIISGSIEAKDDFYFSDRHDERSDAYTLFNLELAYQQENWRVALYGKNIGDELVKTRGFGSFGNDPRKFYTTEPYNQFAAPRLVGLKATMEF